MDKKMFTFLYCLCLCSYVLGSDETTTDSPETTTDSSETTTDSSETTTDSSETTTDFSETTTDISETTTDSSETTTDFSEIPLPKSIEYCGTSIWPPTFPYYIMGGQDARHGQYPWMISLEESTGRLFKHVCGATLINENWIVTAANCIRYVNKPEKYQAFAGLNNLEEKWSTVQPIKISKIVVHKGFNRRTYKDDIALLKTAKPVDIFGSRGYVNAICLPEPKEEPTVYATVVGWGYKYPGWLGGRKSTILREYFVPIISRDQCSVSYDGKIVNTMVCAGVENTGACKEGSGGPMFQTSEYGVSTFVGVVSFGRGCGLKPRWQGNLPGIYTKVSAYLDWMQKSMAKN